MATIVYHARCPDGFAAAWAVRKGIRSGGDAATALRWRGAKYFPAAHAAPPPDVAAQDVLVLDFCYPEPVMRDFVASAKHVDVLDHHAGKLPTLRRLFAEFGEGRFRYSFDDEHSGAYLAWTRFCDGHSVPPLVLYVEDRDLWRNGGEGDLPFSREVNAAIATAPYTFDAYDRLAREVSLVAARGANAPIVRKGAAMLEYQEAVVLDVLSQACPVDFDGVRVLAANCNCSKIVSEVAGRLAANAPFGVAWFYRTDGKIQVSLRSTPDGPDVAAIAKRHGGGGHVHAAGFEVSAPNPLLAILAV